MKYLNYDSMGFSLIEIIAVVGVIAILAVASVTMISQNQYGDDDDRVSASLSKLQHSTKLARTYATTGHLCCGQSTAPFGYGIRIDLSTSGDRNSYFLYADIDADNVYTSGGSDEIVQRNTLDEGVQFSECYAGTGSVFPSVGEYCDVLFSRDYNYYIGTQSLPSAEFGEESGIVIEHSTNSALTETMTVYGETLLIEQQ